MLAELLTQDEVLVGLASGDALSHLQDGYPPKLLRQLRRGQFVIEDELDLHHLRLHEARALLSQFLAECRKGGRRCVRIIHGKARGADHGSVIKAMTDRVLRQRADVIGYHLGTSTGRRDRCRHRAAESRLSQATRLVSAVTRAVASSMFRRSSSTGLVSHSSTPGGSTFGA
ncbi:MAG: Smr/MutS family protein [Gemmatimonadales bacterium]